MRRTSGRSLKTFVRFEASAAKQMKTALLWAITQLITPPIFRGCPQTSLRNYHYSLRNNPRERTRFAECALFAPHEGVCHFPLAFLFLLLFYYILRMSVSRSSYLKSYYCDAYRDCSLAHQQL